MIQIEHIWSRMCRKKNSKSFLHFQTINIITLYRKTLFHSLFNNTSDYHVLFFKFYFRLKMYNVYFSTPNILFAFLLLLLFNNRQVIKWNIPFFFNFWNGNLTHTERWIYTYSITVLSLFIKCIYKFALKN
jgi:hypothetical protein